MNLTYADYLAYEAKRLSKLNSKAFGFMHHEGPEPVERKGCEDESELRRQILEECRRRGWIALHSSTAHRTRRNLGEPDCLIIAENGRFIMCELKRRLGKLSPDQLAFQAWSQKLGFTVHVVRSFEQFLEIIK